MNDDGTYNLSEIQARAILDLRLQRLTALGVKEVTDELEELAARSRTTSTSSARATGSWRSSRTNCAR
jgi:DNA gyrase/topoisomerase IV subunit A